MIRTSITIGIPAYNEMANIGYLIKSLMTQKQTNFSIQKIIVASDGSTDKTVDIIRNLHIKNLKIIDSKLRKGVGYRLNQIIKSSNSPVLVILNADVIPSNNNFLFNLIKPIIENKADLSSGAVRPISYKNELEKIINTGELIKINVFENLNLGNNIYTCRGTARAFSKNLYKKIVFPDSAGDDAYSYLFAISNNYKYRFTRKASVYFKLPNNYKDFEKQVIRFLNVNKGLDQNFNKEKIRRSYYFPKWYFFKIFFKHCLKDFWRAVAYCLLFLFIRIKFSFTTPDNSSVWSVSQSTKVLTNNYE